MKKNQLYKELIKTVTEKCKTFKKAYREKGKRPEHFQFSMWPIPHVVSNARLYYLAYADFKGISLSRVEPFSRNPVSEESLKEFKIKLEQVLLLISKISKDSFSLKDQAIAKNIILELSFSRNILSIEVLESQLLTLNFQLTHGFVSLIIKDENIEVIGQNDMSVKFKFFPKIVYYKMNLILSIFDRTDLSVDKKRKDLIFHIGEANVIKADTLVTSFLSNFLNKDKR